MAVMAIFRATDMSADQYDEAMRRLEASGAGSPNDRRLHVAAVTDGETLTVDVRESEEALARFGAVLAPIVAGLGLNPPQPEVHPVHNLIANEPV